MLGAIFVGHLEATGIILLLGFISLLASTAMFALAIVLVGRYRESSHLCPGNVLRIKGCRLRAATRLAEVSFDSAILWRPAIPHPAKRYVAQNDRITGCTAEPGQCLLWEPEIDWSDGSTFAVLIGAASDRHPVGDRRFLQIEAPTKKGRAEPMIQSAPCPCWL